MTPLDERYFDWLFDQVGSAPDARPSSTYLKMIEQLFLKEFVWIIPNDDNRAEDGRDLRREFVEQRRIRKVDPDWMALGCSMLELFIGIARRMSDIDGGPPRDWFWLLIRNLGLDLYSDSKKFPAGEIDEILDDLIWRTYHPNGRGGLFPLHEPHEDQRDVEIWYQLNAYLLEKAA